MEKEQFEELLQKIDGISEGIRLISERQNSQYTDIMMILRQRIKSGAINTRDTEELYDDAFNVVIKSGKASTSLIQRKLGVGYSEAARLIDMLEEKKIISEGIGSKPRKILIKPEGI
jgi:S-DNA-T family DNA segregation ATPase FtsK/SpoIIIE